MMVEFIKADCYCEIDGVRRDFSLPMEPSALIGMLYDFLSKTNIRVGDLKVKVKELDAFNQKLLKLRDLNRSRPYFSWITTDALEDWMSGFEFPSHNLSRIGGDKWFDFNQTFSLNSCLYELQSHNNKTFVENCLQNIAYIGNTFCSSIEFGDLVHTNLTKKLYLRVVDLVRVADDEIVQGIIVNHDDGVKLLADIYSDDGTLSSINIELNERGGLRMSSRRRVKLFQIENSEYMFRGKSFIERRLGKAFDVNTEELDYKLVFKGDMTLSGEDNVALNKVYEVFNLHHPIGYRGRSASVSDVICIDDMYYIVEGVGFSELPLIQRTREKETVGQVSIYIKGELDMDAFVKKIESFLPEDVSTQVHRVEVREI